MIIIDDDGVMHKVLPMDTLDKIKAEIETLNPFDYGSMFSYESHNGARDMKGDVLDIIYKYRNEVSHEADN